MRTKYHFSLRARLIQLVLLAILPAVGLILYTGAEERRRASRDATSEALRLARVVSISHQRLIDSTRQLLVVLSRLPEVRGHEPRVCGALFSELLKGHPPYANLGATNLKGDIFCSAVPLSKPVNIADRSYFRQTLQQRDFAVGEYQIGRIIGRAGLNFAYPVFDKLGALDGVVFAALDLTWLNQIVAAAHLPRHYTITVWDHKGTILARYPDSARWVGKSVPNVNVVKTVLAKGEGVTEAVGLDGKRRLYGFTWLAESPQGGRIHLTVGIPAEVAFADATRVLIRNLVAVILVSLLALMAAWFGGDVFVLRKLKVLIAVAERLSAGDLSARTGLPHEQTEIGRLTSSVDKMAQNLEARRAEARNSKEQIQKNLERLRALHDIDLAITSTLDRLPMLNLLLEKIDIALPNAVTTIRLVNKETGELEPVACRNIDGDAWRAESHRDVHGLTKIVLENKTAITIASLQTDPRSMNDRFVRRFGLVSYLGIPLIAKTVVVGVISFYTRGEHSFNDEEIEFLTTLAGQSAIAIHNVKLYEETKQRADELSALHALTTAATQSLDLNVVLNEAIKKITEIFHFDATRIFLFNAGMDQLEVKAAFEVKPEFWTQVMISQRGQGIVGTVAETGESLIFEDIRHDPRYRELSQSKISEKAGAFFVAVFPIKTKAKNWGALVCVGEKPRKLEGNEINLLTSMTNQIGIAVENASLYQQTAMKATELSALYSVAGIASESLDIHVILRKTMHKVLEIFGFDASRIYLRDGDGKELRLAAHEGFSEGAIPPSNYQIGEGLVGTSVKNGETIIFDDMQSDPKFAQASQKKVMLRAGFRGSFFIPIKVRGECLGVMNFLSREPHYFPESEAHLINSIAYHLAIAVGNANLFSEVKQKTVELEKANKGKDEFLSIISHELRTPLNIIIGYTTMVKDGAFGEIRPKQEAALATVAKQSGHLLNMVDGLLRVTIIEAGQTKLESEEFNLVDFLDELKSSYEIPLSKEIRLNWNYPLNLPIVTSDSEKLRHILQNLINNAVKFTEKGLVTISARLCSGSNVLECQVTDTGIGIPKEKLPFVFEMFRQVDSSPTRTYGGLGLGLYIVKKYTEVLGGTVEVESEVGKRSVFTLRVPLKIS